MEMKHCPVCLFKGQVEYRRIDNKLMFECTCPRCGTFVTSAQFIRANEDGRDIFARHLLSGLIRELNERGEEVPPILGKDIEELLKHPLVPKDDDYKAKTRKIIDYVKAHVDHLGQGVSFFFEEDRSVAYARDDAELGALITLLLESGVITQVEEFDVGKYLGSPAEFRALDPAHGVLGHSSVVLKLTAKGWDLLADLGAKPTDSTQGFIAIRFDPLDVADDVMGCIKAISEGIVKAGFTSECIKTKVFSEAIMNKALTDISQSKFVVVDLTGDRMAVAFEAGYANALGIDAIYVYQPARGTPQNFYARHYQLLPYEKPEDLTEIVYNAISAYYPK